MSLAAGIGLRGLIAPLVLRGSMTGDAFEGVRRVRELVESVGATIVFLPPYSPDLNLIEMAWSKVKGDPAQPRRAHLG